MSESSEIGEEQKIVVLVDEALAKIAQDLHDSLCQTLSSSRFRIATLGRKLASQGLANEVARCEEAAAQSAQELQEIVQLLQEVNIAPADLRDALEFLVMGVKGSRFSWSGCIHAGDTFVAGQIFRIAREAILRAARNSGSLALSHAESGGVSSLRISADTPCFNGLEDSDHAEWSMARRRARVIHAELRAEAGGCVMLLVRSIPTAGSAS